MAEQLLQIQGVSKNFESGNWPWRRRNLQALDSVDLAVERGQSVGIVGESGSGKSTLCRVVLGLTRPSSGRVLFADKDMAALSAAEMRDLRREMQAVFQDTGAAFNPRQDVRTILLAPLEVHGIGTAKSRLELAADSLRHVGLDASFLERYPYSLSGGQRQRVAIARAIILRPALVVADEPTSALDVSVQARILNLFKEIQRELGLTYLFVSHNLGVIRYVCDSVAVMYLGQIVEYGPIREVFLNPQHPYTRALISAIPTADPDRRQRELPILGELPSSYRMPTGCRFHGRCPVAMDNCPAEDPPLYVLQNNHRAACFWHDPRFTIGKPDWIKTAPEPASIDMTSGPPT